MTTRNLKFSVDEYYHVYNRGTDKREIFLEDKDRDRFIKLLFIGNCSKAINFRDIPKGLPFAEFERGETLIDIGAYVLMPNHFHILIREKVEGGLSIFMNKILTSYSMYFNKKYKRTGRLFEGSFKAKHIDQDEYLKYLFAYIHLNPVKIIDPEWKEKGIQDKIKAEKYLLNYEYSSYLDYLNIDRIQNKILNKESFPQYFEFNKFSDFINEWLNFDTHTKGNPL